MFFLIFCLYSSHSITMNLDHLSCKRTMRLSQFLMVCMASLSFAFRLSLAFLEFRGFISILSTPLIKFSKAVLSVGGGGFLGLSDLSHSHILCSFSSSIIVTISRAHPCSPVVLRSDFEN